MCDNAKAEFEVPTGYAKVVGDLSYLYYCKNKRYGDSFSKQYQEYGIVCSAIRLEDKFRRFKHLVQNPQDSGADESKVDTLKDIANYAIMTLMELDKQGLFTEYQDNGQKLHTETKATKTAL